MRLKPIKLTHFRGYRATNVIPIDEAMTGIAGRNDYSKSTILEPKANKNDMNCFSLAEGAEQFEIVCEFDGLPCGADAGRKMPRPPLGRNISAYGDRVIAS